MICTATVDAENSTALGPVMFKPTMMFPENAVLAKRNVNELVNAWLAELPKTIAEGTDTMALLLILLPLAYVSSGTTAMLLAGANDNSIRKVYVEADEPLYLEESAYKNAGADVKETVLQQDVRIGNWLEAFISSNVLTYPDNVST